MTEPKVKMSWADAKLQGLKRYYNGPCKVGHETDRYTCNNACIQCIYDARKANKGKPKVKRGDPRPPPEKAPAVGVGFKWNDIVRARLMDAYIDTGDIEGARETVGVTASEYHRETERNQEFREAMTKATVLAIQTLEDRALHFAKKGNEKLMVAALKAKLPDQYSEKIKVDNTHTHTVRLSDEELNKRIAKYTALGGGHDYRVVSVIPQGKGGTRLLARGTSAEGSEEQVQDVVPGDGEVLA